MESECVKESNCLVTVVFVPVEHLFVDPADVAQYHGWLD